MFTKEYLSKICKLHEGTIYLAGEPLRNYFFKRTSYNIDIIVKRNAEKLAKNFCSEYDGSFVLLSEDPIIARVILNKNNENLIFDFLNIKGNDIYDDLSKRDFTINAMAIEIIDGSVDFEKVIDPHKGKEDIENKLIRAVSDDVFESDPIRMIRAVRFMSELDFDIDDRTHELIIKDGNKLKDVPGERMTEELFKILVCKRAHYYFNLMDKYLNILNKILPEIEPMKEVGRCKYHVVDSWTHSLHTMRVIENIIYADGYFEKHLKTAYEEHTNKIYSSNHSKIQLIKLAALFHDIGKPSARWVDETGRIRFRGHEVAGEEVVGNISDRLKLSEKEKKFLCKIVKEHMWPLTLYKTNDVSGKALYDLFINFGENTLDIILIGLADIISTRQLLNPHEEMGMYKVHAEYLSNNYLTRFKQLEDITEIINGNDIIENFKIEDRRIIGEIIDSVKRAIFFGKIPLEKDRILNYIETEVL